MLRDDSINYQYQFANLTLNTQLGTVINTQGEEVQLPHLSYQLLCALCEAAPAIVSQQSLIEKVWPNNVVGDETLKQRIKLLRKSLNDNASAPTYIEAIRGRGYRILPSVEVTPLHSSNPSVALNLATDGHLPLRQGENYPTYWKLTSLVLFTCLLLFSCIAILVSSNHHLSQPNQDSLVDVMANSLDNELYQKGLEYYHRYRQEDNRLAIDLFLAAIERDPNMARAYAGLSDAYSQGVFQFNAPSHWQQLAIDAAYKSIALAPNLAQGYKSLGLAYYNRGWLTKAVNANLKALQKTPNYSEAMSNLSFIYRELGQLKQSLNWANKALKANPKNSVSMVHKAQTLTALGQYSQARNTLDRALLLQPDSLLAKEALGHWYLHQGEFTQAWQYYQALNNQYPEQLMFLERLAQSALYLDKRSQTLSIAAQLIASDDSNMQEQGLLLQYLASDNSLNPSQLNKSQLSNSRQLIQLYQQRLSKGSDRPSDSYTLALIYSKMGKEEQAYRYLIQAINQGWLASTLIERHPIFAPLKQQASLMQLIGEIETQLTLQQLR
ncbi:winged helix-turn-helix domain-containing protein [Shewanella colwelliana]|uniref:winged helix-turn-helix domain-containing protein n=1 Tax=Shewanella colwelliana TaxID=23 RepID=UPI0037367048